MNIAIYVRKSVSGDEKSISITGQEEMCKDYFKHKGNNNKFTVYTDNGFSGKTTYRPAFEKLLIDASEGKYDAVVCYKFDRIARNTLDFLTVLELLKSYGTDLVSITEGYDPSTPQGKMMVTLLASLAEMERENIKQRVKDSMYNLAKQGRWSGGTTPFGYEIDRTSSGSFLKLKDADKIEYIFKSFLNGKSHNDIARELNKSAKGIKLILRNPLYMKSSELGNDFLKTLGYKIINHDERLGNGYITYGKRGESEKIAAISIHEAIISASDWIACYEKLKLFDGHARPRISNKTWLAQMVVCKECGEYMLIKTISNQTENSTYYLKPNCKCFKKYINVVKAEKAILNELQNIVINKNDLDSKNIFNPVQNEVKFLENEINSKEKIIAGLIEKLALTNGSISDRLIGTIEKLENEIETLSMSRTQKLLILEGKPKLKKTFNTEQEISNFINEFKKMNIKDKQSSIRNVINNIEFDGKDLYIN